MKILILFIFSAVILGCSTQPRGLFITDIGYSVKNKTESPLYIKGYLGTFSHRGISTMGMAGSTFYTIPGKSTSGQSNKVMDKPEYILSSLIKVLRSQKISTGEISFVNDDAPYDKKGVLITAIIEEVHSSTEGSYSIKMKYVAEFKNSEPLIASYEESAYFGGCWQCVVSDAVHKKINKDFVIKFESWLVANNAHIH